MNRFLHISNLNMSRSLQIDSHICNCGIFACLTYSAMVFVHLHFEHELVVTFPWFPMDSNGFQWLPMDSNGFLAPDSVFLTPSQIEVIFSV